MDFYYLNMREWDIGMDMEGNDPGLLEYAIQ